MGLDESQAFHIGVPCDGEARHSVENCKEGIFARRKHRITNASIKVLNSVFSAIQRRTPRLSLDRIAEAHALLCR